ncbi:putative adenine-specific methylase [Microcystis phage Mel-JY03]
MGKRSTFERLPRDFYPTPAEAVAPLLPHLQPATTFFEPCAGDGALVRHLEAAGHICALASDIEPQADWIEQRCALTGTLLPMRVWKPVFITNPPWDRRILHPIIDRLSRFAPTLLLFDSDWVHTLQAAPYQPYLAKIVSVGRVRWIPGTAMTGKDNCAWHLFDRWSDGPTKFFGRAA